MLIKTLIIGQNFSALNCLVCPDLIIKPDNLTLKAMGKEARRNWAVRVPGGLLAETVIFGYLVFRQLVVGEPDGLFNRLIL
jgi:hypothetical protein